jgi:hypothetical protein
MERSTGALMGEGKKYVENKKKNGGIKAQVIVKIERVYV